MAAPTRRPSSAQVPDLFDWLQSPWASLLPFAYAHTFRVEDYAEDDRYVVRAELPGLDPEKDIEVTVDAGVLTIYGERREERKEASSVSRLSCPPLPGSAGRPTTACSSCSG